MPYQKPKENHPWRKYANVKTVRAEERTDIIPVKEFIDDLASNWPKIEVTLSAEYEGRRTFHLTELPQARAAAWIAGMLKRYYVGGDF